ncbi:hypothetical protein Tco_0110905 [Tanacetum coccineum]
MVVARCGRGCEGRGDEGGEAMVLAVATVVVSVVMAVVVLWWAAVGRQPEEGRKIRRKGFPAVVGRKRWRPAGGRGGRIFGEEERI